MAAFVLVFGLSSAEGQSYPDYSEIGPMLLAVENSYPAIAKRYDLGSSVQGRSIWAIRISDNVGVEEDEPEFKYISTMHGDEIVGVVMCLNLVDYLTTNYGSNPQVDNIVNEMDSWIVPLMNPDGYDQYPRTRNNAQGINLNRDFPEYGEPNTPDGRAPETAVIMNWGAAHSFVVSANFHGGALVVNYPFDNEDTGSRYTPDEDLFIYISEEYSQHNLPMWNGNWYHGITNGADWYMIWGGMQDWNYLFMGCNDVTIELSNSKQPPASQLPQFWAENRDSMLAYMATALIGVRGLVTVAGTGLPVAATVTVVGRDHEIYTDPDVGDYHRMLLPGTYDLRFEAEGYDARLMADVVVDSGDATRVDVVLGAAAQVTSPNGGEVLPAGVPTTVSWTGSPTAQFHVQYTANAGATEVVMDDFESGSLDPAYTTGGDADWYVTTSSVHSGLYSARSGNITHNELTWLTRTADGGDMSFWYRVSSESGWDYFNFYIDGEREIHASGTSGGWTFYSTTLPAGSHELEWEYRKDGNTSEGSDCAWIDDVQLTEDVTVWTDIVALTDPGATSVEWIPLLPGEDNKVRVRTYYGDGGYGAWDESDATFTVAPGTANGDYDNDGDVDMRDFVMFPVCLGTEPSPECTNAFDFVVDDTVDLEDFAAFALLLEGPQ